MVVLAAGNDYHDFQTEGVSNFALIQVISVGAALRCKFWHTIF